MNWNALSTLAEVIAAVAVAVSLIYLAPQIRAQIRESQLTATPRDRGGLSAAVIFSPPKKPAITTQLTWRYV